MSLLSLYFGHISLILNLLGEPILLILIHLLVLLSVILMLLHQPPLLLLRLPYIVLSLNLRPVDKRRHLLLHFSDDVLQVNDLSLQMPNLPLSLIQLLGCEFEFVLLFSQFEGVGALVLLFLELEGRDGVLERLDLGFLTLGAHLVLFNLGGPFFLVEFGLGHDGVHLLDEGVDLRLQADVLEL